jgi:hypothetical protein
MLPRSHIFYFRSVSYDAEVEKIPFGFPSSHFFEKEGRKDDTGHLFIRKVFPSMFKLENVFWKKEAKTKAYKKESGKV